MRPYRGRFRRISQLKGSRSGWLAHRRVMSRPTCEGVSTMQGQCAQRGRSPVPFLRR